MQRPRTGRGLARANATETEDINAPLMRLMKDFSITLTRAVIKDSSVVSELTADASTSQQARDREQAATKKTDEPSIRQLDETNSNESQPNATASTLQQVKRRGKQPAKTNVEAKKRSLRSNSSVDEVSFETPERRMKRKKRIQPPNTLPGIDSETSDDEQPITKIPKVTHRRKRIHSSSIDEDDSVSRLTDESKELTHSDGNESMTVTSKLVHSTMVHGKMPSTLNESDDEFTPFLSEEFNYPEPSSDNSSPVSAILLGHGPKAITQNPMDRAMEETPRSAPKSKEIRREKMILLKSTYGTVGEPSTSTDDNRYDPEEDSDTDISFNRQSYEEIVNVIAEAQAAQKKDHSSKSVFDTPDDMESDDVETNEAVETSGMNVIHKKFGETSAIEENNNIKASSKSTANVVQSTTAHEEGVDKNVTTTSKGSTAIPKNVLNELTGALEIRNEQKKANEAQSQSVHDAARHENSSDLSTMVENPIDDENGMMAHKTDNNASQNDVDMTSNSNAENYLEEPGPSTSAVEAQAPLPKRINKRKLPTTIDVSKPTMPGPLKFLDKALKFTRHGFLEETFYETPADGIFVFNAQPHQLNVAVDSFNPRKRRRVIELEADEVIIIKQKRPKNKATKKVLKRRLSD